MIVHGIFVCSSFLISVFMFIVSKTLSHIETVIVRAGGAIWLNTFATRTITVALDMSKAFDTINIHTLIRKLLQTNIPGTIIKFIANYMKGRKAYTTYRNHTSKQRQFKTGVPQGGVLSPTLFNIYTSDLSPPSAPV